MPEYIDEFVAAGKAAAAAAAATGASASETQVPGAKVLGPLSVPSLPFRLTPAPKTAKWQKLLALAIVSLGKASVKGRLDLRRR